MNFECYRSLEINLEEIQLLADAAENSLNDHSVTRGTGNAMTRAGLVLLCGLLEGFIRELAEECVEIINENNLTLHSLPDPVFCTIMEKLTAQYRRNEESIKTTVNPGNFLRLEKRLFSNTGGNPTVDTIEKIFSGLGIPTVIDKLTIRDYAVETTFLSESHIDSNTRQRLQAAITAHVANAPPQILEEITQLIDNKWTPKKKRRKVGYINEIEQLLSKRNRIAHGEGEEQITPRDLRDFLEMVRRLSKGLHDLASDLLTELTVPA